jgi:ABC-type glycerol-3-phosphate transport system substrate-binding protein
VALCLLISPTVRAQGQLSPSPEGRVRVTSWEKWTGMEKEAMEAVIQDFNRSQSRIWVEYPSVSRYQHQTPIATGGDPPDIAGLLGPLLFLTDQSTFTLTLGLQAYQSREGGTQWHDLMAASVMTTLPSFET